MAGLHAERLKHLPSPDGVFAEFVFIEPNGEEHWARALCRPDGTTEVHSQTDYLAYLEERYGKLAVGEAARQAVLA